MHDDSVSMMKDVNNESINHDASMQIRTHAIRAMGRYF